MPGLSVKQVQHVLHETLRAGNLSNPSSIVEFGAEAASPHGGFSGDKRLEKGDLVLIDVEYATNSQLTCGRASADDAIVRYSMAMPLT